MLGDYQPRDFAIEFWDGSTWEAETPEPRFTIVLKHPGALRRMFLPPNELTMGEAYIFGEFEVRGSLYDVMGLAEYFLDQQEWGLTRQLSARLVLAAPAARLAGRPGAPRRAGRRAAFHHQGPSGDPLPLRRQQRVLFALPR